MFTVTDSYNRRSGKHTAKIRKQGGNVVTYFCTPKGHVLHFLVGPVRADQLLESAQWSQEKYLQLIEQEEKGLTLKQRRRWMAIQHEEHLSQETEVLGKVTEWLSGKSGIEKLAGAEQVEKTFEETLKSLQSLTGDDGHQLLQQNPLPLLNEIEAPVFEVLAGESFSRRANQLRERVLNNVQDGQPTLLTVANLSRVRVNGQWFDVDAVGHREPDPNHYLPNADRVRKHLHAYRCEVLTSGELTMVVAALDHPPLSSPYGTQPKFVIIDRQGEIVHVVTDAHPVGVLARMLAKHAHDNSNKTPKSSVTESAPISSEQLARSELRLATLLLAKRPEKAVQRLKKIVTEYPNTDSAASAEKLLVGGRN